MVDIEGDVTSLSRSPDGGECGICGGVLVEMCTETPQSQRSIKIQNMLTEMLHPPASIVVRTRSLELVRVRVSSLVVIERNAGGRKLNILVT